MMVDKRPNGHAGARTDATADSCSALSFRSDGSLQFEIADDPSPDTAPPVPFPPNAAGVTHLTWELEGRAWPEVVARAGATVERTLLHDIARAVALPDSHIRVIGVEAAAGKLLARFAMVHDAAITEAELRRRLRAWGFHGMRTLLELHAETREAQRSADRGSEASSIAYIQLDDADEEPTGRAAHERTAPKTTNARKERADRPHVPSARGTPRNGKSPAQPKPIRPPPARTFDRPTASSQRRLPPAPPTPRAAERPFRQHIRTPRRPPTPRAPRTPRPAKALPKALSPRPANGRRARRPQTPPQHVVRVGHTPREGRGTRQTAHTPRASGGMWGAETHGVSRRSRSHSPVKTRMAQMHGELRTPRGSGAKENAHLSQ